MPHDIIDNLEVKLSEVLESPKDLQREVVLIDECHYFRNPEIDRYCGLLLTLGSDTFEIMLNTNPS